MKNKYETDGNVTRIYINHKGGECIALIDTEDLPKIEGYAWTIAIGGRDIRQGRLDRRYAKAGRGKSTIKMHRFLIDAPVGLVVDHINGDCLDNRKCNLRVCTNRQNLYNQKAKRNSSSKYKGVCRRTSSTTKWEANITAEGIAYYLGRYNDEEEAARIYDQAAREHHREFAHLNFPDEEIAEELAS